jgi:membrane-bound lytic murein transglycosylase A
VREPLTHPARRRARPAGALVAAGVGLALAASGCAWVLRPFRIVPPPLVEVDPDELPSFADDLDPASLRTAVAASVGYYERETATRFVVANRSYTGADFALALRAFLADLEHPLPAQSLAAICRRFRVLRATGGGRPVRFTGYYTPLLHARLQPGDPYVHPLYGRPADLLAFDLDRVVPGCDCATGTRSGRLQNGLAVPYYSRAEIDAGGALRGRGLELAWTDDPIGLFFLHMQGSGELLLPDGRRMHVNYAGTNGLAFRSIGSVLAARGALPPGGGSMQALRAYLEAHPAERDAVLHENPRYTFFALADRGPFGSTRVELTAGRSIATDPEVFPPGALGYVRTRRPAVDTDGSFVGWVPLTRLVLNQDSGAAIKGPARVDVYFGPGEMAGAVAGRMSADGDLFILVPRAPARPTDAATAPRATPRPS